jgi:phosphatidylglycerophosphatase C
MTQLRPLDAPQRSPVPENLPQLAIFDLDGTIVKGDTLLPFLLWFAWRRRRVWPLLKIWPLLALYAVRLLSAKKAKEQLLVTFLQGEQETVINEHAERFVRGWVSRHLREEVVSKLREHQAQGHRVILLSASPDLYVAVVARYLGIPETIATKVQMADGSCRGLIVGDNCRGEAKLAALKAHLGEEVAPPGSFAYGDSDCDLPTLRWVAHGVRV